MGATFEASWEPDTSPEPVVGVESEVGGWVEGSDAEAVVEVAGVFEEGSWDVGTSRETAGVLVGTGGAP